MDLTLFIYTINSGFLSHYPALVTGSPIHSSQLFSNISLLYEWAQFLSCLLWYFPGLSTVSYELWREPRPDICLLLSSPCTTGCLKILPSLSRRKLFDTWLIITCKCRIIKLIPYLVKYFPELTMVYKQVLKVLVLVSLIWLLYMALLFFAFSSISVKRIDSLAVHVLWNGL